MAGELEEPMAPATQIDSEAADTKSHAEYIGSMLAELQKLANSRQLQMLAHLLSMARHEALALVEELEHSDSRQGGSGQKDASSEQNLIHEHTIDWWREQLDQINDPDA
ncbi:MAG: hypothetical protein AAGH82_05715 [Pseudomonadota bacterium]